MLGDDGFGSWPPDLFGLDNWLRLQAHKLSIVTIQDEFYLADLPRQWTTAERKYALIIRDPLTCRYEKKLSEWLKDQSNESLSGEVNDLHQALEIKWHFRIHIPQVVLGNVEEALSRLESGLIIRLWRPIFAKPEAVKDLRKHPGSLLIDPKTREIIDTGYETSGLIYCPPPLIPIAFDPTMLTLADADRVKKAAWNIVSTEIKKLQDGKGPGWNPVAPSGEPKALAEVLRCRPANFEKYLRWYDLRLATVPFRVIAYYELGIGEPETRDAIYENVIGARKNPKVRHKVKGESKVRKGHDLIYFAFHRKKFLDDEDKILLFGLFKCPIHEDNKCPRGCKYLAEFMRKYNKWFKDSYRRESFNPEPRDTAQETD
jgi:hypothetical protein